MLNLIHDAIRGHGGTMFSEFKSLNFEVLICGFLLPALSGLAMAFRPMLSNLESTFSSNREPNWKKNIT